MADHLLVIGRGQILADCSMTEFMADHAASYVRVKAPALADAARCSAAAASTSRGVDDELRVVGLDAAGRRRAARSAPACVLHELTLVRSSLEDAFMTLTADSVEYHAATPPRPTTAGAPDDRDH